MAIIRSLFDSKRALSRPIEKVITYQAASDAQLKAEVSEYVVTDHIEENFDRLLKLMQTAAQGGAPEVGVWVSGFYGSGKSSFTKYLGFALDRRKMVAGDSFLHLLQNQIKTATVRALFNTVSTLYDPEVIFLDLASEMLAEASMADISTVLYRKVLQWAGYSEDIKIAELERMLEKDNKLAEFQKRAQAEADGEPWNQVHNQPLVANAIASRLACRFYPNLFKTEESFPNLSIDLAKSEIRRAEEMLELVFRKSGKKNVFFIIDEVGQYVSAKPNLITNLDGLAKNIKQIGGGHAWIFATAQQTLTEDNPSAIINAPGLFKLKDRFPIQIHLEASDIKEICHKRLLTKSAPGEEALGKIFDAHGSSLRTATQLKDAGVYEQPLDRTAFIDLYPFLPAHFEILLQLLGRLARKTGGLGLRSAIKVLQDVLLESGGRASGEPALADAEVGTLANTVTFYDSLRHDLQSSYAHIVEGVTKVSNRFPGKKLHLDVAKSIAVLQILENLPVTAHNIAALLHPNVKASSLSDQVGQVIQELLKDGFIPLGEKNGSLRFLTQAAVTLQKEFDLIEYLAFKPDVHLVVDWKEQGRAIEAFFVGARIHKTEVYFQPAVTYSRRSLKGLSFRVLPAGCICGEKGPVIIAPGREYAVLAVTNSSPYKYLVNIQCAASAFEIGAIQKTPVPPTFPQIEPILSTNGRSLVSLFMTLANWDETDVHFQWPPSCRNAKSLSEMATRAKEESKGHAESAWSLLEKTDQILLAAYNWPSERSTENDYEKMLEGFHIGNSAEEICRLLLSVCFGAMFGEFSRDFARNALSPQDPYASLPQGHSLLPPRLAKVRTGTTMADDGIVVDDDTNVEGVRSLQSRIRQVLRDNFLERADGIELEASSLLQVRKMRDYLGKPTGFFADHLKRYSKSRRQAPIYWPLSTASGKYTLWLYYHRLTDQTLHTALADFVDPKIKTVERDIEVLRERAGGGGSQIGESQEFLDELRDFRAEIERIIKLPWKPNLNDGVFITSSPLWKLFRLPKWRKDLEVCWKELERGDYDWAHLAYSIWPDRVKEKCKTDRSLAIAHGLETICQVAVPVPKAKRGRKKQVELEGLEE